MRAILAILLVLAALVRAWMDWQATIGQGYAYRLKPIGQVLAETWPSSFGRFLDNLQHSGVPLLWDPLAAGFFAFPLALIAALLGAGLWLSRRWT
jgi:hypothetical protein